jgi:RND family efflux transporter MFP subunit
MRTTDSRPSDGFLARNWFYLATVLLLLLGLAACSDAASKPDPAPPVVRVQTVAFEPDVTERRYTGVVAARHEADQAFRVAGKIAERLVDVGERVEAGQPLARLDPQDLDLQVESAEAEVAAATAAVAQATADEARAKQLADRKVTSDADHERRRLALDEARGRLARAERQLELARNQRTYATLEASSAGVVTGVSAEAGQVVAIGQTVTRIAGVDEIEVEVAIPESRLGDLRDAAASVTLWADGSMSYPAELRELAAEADPATRTYVARFALQGADEQAKLGMTATLVLKRGTGARVSRLPLSAILEQGTGPAVYVVEPNSGALTLRPVKVLRYGTDEVIVSAGVNDGERVVTLGVNRLTPKQKIRVEAAN